MQPTHEQSLKHEEDVAIEKKKNLLLREIPALAPYDIFNPLRIPTSDPQAEQEMWQALNRNPPSSSPKDKEGDKANDTQKDTQPEAESIDERVDPSMIGVLKTIGRLAKFSCQLSPRLTAAGFALGSFASLQGVATGFFISSIQGSGQLSIAGALALTSVGVLTSATLFTAWACTQFTNERFAWMSAVFWQKSSIGHCLHSSLRLSTPRSLRRRSLR